MANFRLFSRFLTKKIEHRFDAGTFEIKMVLLNIQSTLCTVMRKYDDRKTKTFYVYCDFARMLTKIHVDNFL
jgi:hypothetical protein